MSTAAEIAAALRGRQTMTGWEALCPAHPDRRPSLSICEGSNGIPLLHCHAGCSQKRVIDAVREMGFTLNGKPGGRKPARRIEATYDYRDEQGHIVYQVVRWHPKDFRQRRPNGSTGWVDDVKGVTRVPYRLPELLANTAPIYIVEGEKDADRLASLGLTATTNSGGASTGNRSDWPGLARWFTGRRVIVVPDNDEPGLQHAKRVARALNGVAHSIKVLTLPDLRDKGDVSDWLDAGNTIDEFRRLAHATPRVDDPATGSGESSDLQNGIARKSESSSSQNKTAREIPGDSAGSSSLADLQGGPSDDNADDNASSDEVELSRLASLSPLAYERERGDAAKRLRVRVETLDRLVDKRRPKAEESGAEQVAGIGDVEPWPEPVDGAVLLDEIASTIRRYVVMNNDSADAAALWVLHSHALDAAYVTPRLSINSPEMRCGKTTLLDVLKMTVARPLSVANITTATLFRVLEATHPTLLIDEVDAFVGSDDELRGVINAGHCRASATVLRCVGDNHDVKAFGVWGAMALAGIGQRPGTIADRSITISLRRKRPDEPVERLRLDRLEVLRPLGQRAARWSVDHLDDLKATDPQVPVELHDRAADNWRPLIAIADLAGQTWPQRARQAAVALTVATEDDADSIRTMLLADLRDLFEKEEVDHLTSGAIIAHLVTLEERPWADFKGGKPISVNQLPNLLKPFGVRPRQTWSGRKNGGKNNRRYHRTDLEDVFARYLSPSLAVNLLDPLEPAEMLASDVLQAARVSPGLAVQIAKNPRDSAGSSSLAAPIRDSSSPSWWRAAIRRTVQRDREATVERGFGGFEVGTHVKGVQK